MARKAVLNIYAKTIGTTPETLSEVIGTPNRGVDFRIDTDAEITWGNATSRPYTAASVFELNNVHGDPEGGEVIFNTEDFTVAATSGTANLTVSYFTLVEE